MQGGILQTQAMKTLNRSLGMFSAFAGAVLLSCAAAADDAVGVNAYASFDASSAYVLYCARQNKDPCFWTFAEIDLLGGRCGTMALSLWQNTDATSRRKNTMRRMNEWDWRVAYLNVFQIAEDWTLAGEAGHIWYKYHGLRGKEVSKAFATMMELYGRVSLDNPYLTPYLFATFDHRVTEGMFVLAGIKRDFRLSQKLVFTPEITIGGGDDRYLSCLYPARKTDAAVACTQLSGRLEYAICRNVALHASLSFSVIADDEIRGAIDEVSSDYAKQFVWGNIGVSVSF